MPFQKAVKYGSRLRLSLDGPTGAGKTYSALLIAREIIKRRYKGEGRIAVIDTEKGSAAKYADRFDFDTIVLDDYHPQNYLGAIKEAEEAGDYRILIIDSLSHAWAGKGGVLELKDRATQRTGNSYTAWGDVTPLQNKLIDSIVGSSMDVIATLRSKMDHAVEEYDDGGKKKTRVIKLGLAPIQRDGVEYEFDVVVDIDVQHRGFISKTRCFELDGKVFEPPNEELAKVLVNWLDGPDAPIVEKPADSFDQLGKYRAPNGSINGLSFMAQLQREGCTSDDLTRIAKPANGSAKADVGGWLKANTDKTLEDLIALVKAAREEAAKQPALPT